MKKLLSLCLLAALPLLAELAYNIDDLTIRIGGDARLRYETFDRAVSAPDGNPAGNHPKNQYFRLRTRLWTALDYDDFTLNLRLANRVHYVLSSPAKKNNDGAGTWEFPDEIYVDDANLVIRNLGVENLTLTLGRQSLSLGNGMILCEGTPFDQGRSVYMDGLRLRYQTDSTDANLFAFYNDWKDRTVFLNDRNRRLHSGKVFTAGTYVTQTFSDAFKLDAYYLFNDVDDKHPLSAERYHYADSSASIHTIGLRAFGRPCDLLDYSLEIAQQAGRNATGGDLKGRLADARLCFHLPVWEEIKPTVGLEYTYLSGDKRSGKDSRGWIPLLSQCPLWSEELIPILLNGYWSNLSFFRLDTSATFCQKCKITLSVTDYTVPETHGGPVTASGHGDHLGLLLSTDVSYKLNDNISFLAQLSHFNPGDYYIHGCKGFWGRLQVIASF